MTISAPNEEQQMGDARIQPTPLPIQFMCVPVRVNTTDAAGSDAIMFAFVTPQGESYFFLAPAAAEKFKLDLENALRMIKTGLIIPENGRIATS